MRGTTGTYTKFGADPQEEQLKAMATPSEIFSIVNYGREPVELFGTLENLQGDEVVRSM